jgi:hypothetical protein
LKALAVVPALPATGFPWLLSEIEEKTGTEQFSHKFKLSLNVYSFNNPLREGKIDLFDVLDFCAEYNFDAIDPTGYYFPGIRNHLQMNISMNLNEKLFCLDLI